VIIFNNEFEWDEEKAARNLQKHGVSFEEAATIFAGFSAMYAADPEHSIGEIREIAIGISFRGRVLTVSFTERGGLYRLISARNSTTPERKSYENG
jgi:uncharacterized protein